MPTPPIPSPKIEEGAYFVPDELRDAYHLALGRFADTFGSTETSIAALSRQYVKRYIKLDGVAAISLTAAITGGRGVAQLTDMIRRVMIATESSKEDLDALSYNVKHLEQIGKIRNRIFHNGGLIEYYLGAWMVSTSNHNHAMESKKIDRLSFTIETLEDMTEDLWSIMTVFRPLLNPKISRLFEGLPKIHLQPEWRYDPKKTHVTK